MDTTDERWGQLFLVIEEQLRQGITNGELPCPEGCGGKVYWSASRRANGRDWHYRGGCNNRACPSGGFG